MQLSKWFRIFEILDYAAKINMRRSTISLVIELLRQFNRSLVNSESQPKPKQAVKAGFVYVIRDRANGERFKIGHRASPPWRNSQLLSELDESGDFILIIPAKDASDLEKSLRRAYAKHSKKSDWFALNDGERREMLIIAALVQVAAGDDLGMSTVDNEIVQLAADLLNQLQRLARAVLDKRRHTPQQPDEEDGPTKTEIDLDDFSTTPEFDWNWESVLDEDYRVLPKLKGKSGYVCIVRDTETDNYRVFFEDHPVDAIDGAFLETGLRFPLEIFLVLEIENMKKAKEALLLPSESKHRTEWVNLSMEELGEIKRSATEAYAHGSVYVNPKKHWGLETLSCDAYKDYPKLEKPEGYVCIVQGVKPGKRRKIWRLSRPRRLGGDKWRTRKLNSPHDLLTASEPIRFNCIIKAKYAKSFQDFLHKRYRAHRKRNGWFELEDVQLKEIRRFGK